MSRREAFRNPLTLEAIYRGIHRSRGGITFNRLLYSSQGVASKDSTLRRILRVLVASGTVSESRLFSPPGDVRWANLKRLPILYKTTGLKPRLEVGVKAYLYHGVSFDYDPSLPFHSILDETDWVGLSRASFSQENEEAVAFASPEDLLIHALSRWNSPAASILRPVSVMLYGSRRLDTRYLYSRASQKHVQRLLQRFLASFKVFDRIRPGDLARRPTLVKVRTQVLVNHPELRWVKASPLLPGEEVLDLSSKEALSR